LITQRGNQFAPGVRFGTIRLADVVEHELGEGLIAFPSFDSSEVYYRTLDAPGELRAVPITGGASRVVARFPGAIALGVAGPDGPHVMIERDGIFEGWRAGDRGPESEGVAGLVSPAPSGGWRIVVEPERAYRVRFVAPDSPLSATAFTAISHTQSNPWLDDHHVVLIDDTGQYAIFDVATGTSTRRVAGAYEEGDVSKLIGTRERTMLPDGRFVEMGGSDRPARQLIRNFGDRPWRP
jgi:hypothetical protein